MAAYPLGPAVTLGEFIARAGREFGATLEELERPVMGPRGPEPMRYLLRGSSFAILPRMDDEEPLLPDVLRSLCERLAIPPSEFGLDLTE